MDCLLGDLIMTLVCEAKRQEKMLSPSQQVFMTYSTLSPMLNPQHTDIVPFPCYHAPGEPRRTPMK